jgi:hypothetical protein
MGRIVLIVFAVIGGLVFAFGALGVLIAATSPGPDQADTYTGAIFFIVVGAVIAVPCTFFAYRMTRRMPMPVGPSGLPMAAADLRQNYLQWFAWCQQALPGADAISLNAATMAAMSATAAGNPTDAATAEAARHANRIAVQGTMPAPPSAAKVKMLSRIGASTIGLLEPSERVLVSFYGQNLQGRAWGAMFGAIGTVVSASQSGAVFVTVTDRRVIALIAGQYGGLANRVGLIEPRTSVSVKARKSLFGRNLSLRGIGGGSVSMSLPRLWQPEAAIAAEMLAPSIGQVSAVGIIR